jgi:hypothetical protein
MRPRLRSLPRKCAIKRRKCIASGESCSSLLTILWPLQQVSIRLSPLRVDGVRNSGNASRHQPHPPLA